MRTCRCLPRGLWFPYPEKAIFPGPAMRRAFCEKRTHPACERVIRVSWKTDSRIRESRTSFEPPGARRNDLWRRLHRGGGRARLLHWAFESRWDAVELAAWVSAQRALRTCRWPQPSIHTTCQEWPGRLLLRAVRDRPRDRRRTDSLVHRGTRRSVRVFFAPEDGAFERVVPRSRCRRDKRRTGTNLVRRIPTRWQKWRLSNELEKSLFRTDACSKAMK